MSDLMLRLSVEQKPKFFQRVPVEQICRCYMHTFELLGRGPDDLVTLELLVEAFERVKREMRSALRQNIFIHVIDYVSDSLRESFRWSYYIVSDEIQMKFDVHTVHMSGFEQNNTLTIKQFLRGMEQELIEADRAIAQFNHIVGQGIKPLAAKIPVDRIVNAILDRSIPLLIEEYTRLYGVRPRSMQFLKASKLRTGVYVNLLSSIPPVLLDDNSARLVFDVFGRTDIGWGDLRILMEFKNVGIRYLLATDEIPLFQDFTVNEMPAMLSFLLKRADSTSRNWNWLLNSGHREKDKWRQMRRRAWEESRNEILWY